MRAALMFALVHTGAPLSEQRPRQTSLFFLHLRFSYYFVSLLCLTNHETNCNDELQKLGRNNSSFKTDEHDMAKREEEEDEEEEMLERGWVEMFLGLMIMMTNGLVL